MAPGINPAQQAPNMKPDYEVKLQLDPSQVLNVEHDVLPTVLNHFDMPLTAAEMNVQFLDTCSQDISAAGWSLRMRKYKNKPDLELNYKKRYDIEKITIDDALTKANGDGFDVKDTNYEAQVEWGYAKQTLSISREKTVPCAGNGVLDLMDTIGSRAILIKHAPGKFDNWGRGDKWGTKALEKSAIYGPILARRWVGTWNNKKIYIEVWPVRDSDGTGIEHIVEASFKADDYQKACDGREKLIKHLNDKGWLLERDLLKTKLIMERYSCPRVAGGRE